MRAIERNEVVEIFYHGTLKAILSPATTQKSKKIKIKNLPGIGMWKDREEMKDPTAYVQKIRKPRYDIT